MGVQNRAKPATEYDIALQQAHALFRQNKYEEVVPLYRKLLQSNLNDCLIWGNLGIALRNLKQFEPAFACLQRAGELLPGSAAVIRHAASCLVQMGRKEEALQAFAEALRLAPDDFNVRAYYAFALREFDMGEESLAQYNAAHQLDPSHLDTVWARTDVYLRLGRFREAWKDFEIRWKLDSSYPFAVTREQEKNYSSKRWAGEDVNGKMILVYEEQGFGDIILCSRYVPLLKERGAKVIFKCPRDLHRLFHTIPGIEKLVEGTTAADKIDYHVPVMSLPGLFGTEVSAIPPAAPLHVPEKMPAEAARLLGLAKDRFKVGIVWIGRPTFPGNYKRAVSLKRFLPLAEIPGVQLYNLQKGPGEEQLTECGAGALVLELGPHVKDFADTAAILKQLDLVIMTDSSVAHLAGSIGCPVWNLLCNGAYWVYLLQREDSPWYPSMRLFRQPEPGDWDGVFKKVSTELAKAVALKKAGKWKR